MKHWRVSVGWSMLAIPAAMLASGVAHAVDVTTSAGVAPAVTYTDNVCLSNSDKEGEWVALVTPTGSVSMQSRKAQLNVNGSVQFNSLTNSQLKDRRCGGGYGNREQWRPRLNADGKVTLVDNLLFVDARARADQNEVNANRRGGGDDLNRTGNTNTYYRYSVSPYLTHRYHNYTRSSLRYTFDQVENSEERLSDTRSHQLAAQVGNAQLTQFSWAVIGNARRVEYEDSINGIPRKDTELKNARVRLGHKVHRSLEINGSYGWEWNDFETARPIDTDGNAWDVGFRFTPTERTLVDVGLTDRFFGDTPRVNISHRQKRSLYTLSYDKTIKEQYDIRLLEEDDLLDGNFSALDARSPILDERLSAGYTYSGRRATINVRGSYSEQTRAEDGAQGVFQNYGISYSPNWSRRYTMSAALSWDLDEPQGTIFDSSTGNDSETWRTNIRFGRKFNDRLDASMDYQFTIRRSDLARDEYEENRITWTLNLRL